MQMRATTQGNALVDYLITHAESLLRDLHANSSGPASAAAGPLRTLSPSRPAVYVAAAVSGELGAETQVCLFFITMVIVGGVFVHDCELCVCVHWHQADYTLPLLESEARRGSYMVTVGDVPRSDNFYRSSTRMVARLSRARPLRAHSVRAVPRDGYKRRR